MMEYKRIFLNKKVLGLLLVIFFLNAFLFVREQESVHMKYIDRYKVSIQQIYSDYNTIITPYRGMELDASMNQYARFIKENFDNLTEYERYLYSKLESSLFYYSEYGQYLKSIEEQAETMNTISIFMEEDSFAHRNIIKTVEDFKKLEGRNLLMGIDENITSVISFTLGDYLVLLLIMVISYHMLAERKNGLWEIVHISKNGRGRLAVKRLISLFFASVFICMLIYGTNQVLALKLYGGYSDFSRPIQSVISFAQCDMVVSVKEFMIGYLGVKIISTFLIGVLVWLVLSTVNNLSVGMLLMAVVLGIEYSLYQYLPMQSIFNVFKYLNIFSYVDLAEIYTKYQNILFLSSIKSVRGVVVDILPICIILVVSGIFTIQVRKHPKEVSVGLHYVMNFLQYLSNSILSKLGTVGLEVYKILIVRKGIIVLIVFGVFQYQSLVSGEVFYGRIEGFYNQYMEQLEGPLNDNTIEIFESMKSAIVKEEQEVLKLGKKLQDGSISIDEYKSSMSVYDRLSYKQEAIIIVSKQIERLQESQQVIKKPLWVMKEYAYDSLFGENNYKQQTINFAYGLFVIVLLLAGMYADERKTGMWYLLRSTKEGRKKLFHKKELAGIILVFVVTVLLCFVELYNANELYGLSGLMAPVQSLSCLKEFPFELTILSFITIMYVGRVIVLIAIMYWIYFISMVVVKEEFVILLATIICVVPSVLYYIGIEAAKPFATSVTASLIERVVGGGYTIISICPVVISIVIAFVVRRVSLLLWER